jgi:pilus assembly protein CpaD
LENAMTSLIASRPAFGFKPVAPLFLLSLLALAVTGCKTLEEPGGHFAGLAVIDPSERHPIMVSQQPATLNVRVARSSQGLTPAQKGQIAGFLERYRAADAGNSKLVIGVPSGSPNETAAMHSVNELRHMIAAYGFSDSAVAVEPYYERGDAAAPIRLSYLRYIAEGPECGVWTHNLADDRRNLPYSNFGCAQQRNLAAQIANPADLLGPRTMDPADSERRTIVYDKYRQGKTTAAEKGADERVQVKGAN